jgi:hypothetical protein
MKKQAKTDMSSVDAVLYSGLSFLYKVEPTILKAIAPIRWL